MALTMKSINKVFQNKIVLYILLGLSFFNLLGYLARNNLSAIIVFLLTGYFSTFFTKNMSYILLAPLVITNFVVALFTMQKIKFKEGMKDKNSDDKHEKHNKHDNDDDHEKEDSDDEDHKVKGASLTKKSKNSESSKPKKIENMTENYEDDDDDDDDEDDDNFVSAKIKKHENMENAYNNLEKMMGPKNMSKMSNGIKGIANDQKELYKIVEKMEPLFDKVSGMLDKFSNSPLATMLPKISNNDNN
tara:strand:- start:59 stop:796 length:738 start_codon:yes stop_codon:yes gene_type:complete